MRRRELTPEEVADAKRLKAAWLAYKDANPGANQTWLAAESGLGTQGAVGQYLRGKIPLNMPALLAMCRVMQLNPSDISPRLGMNLIISDEAHAGRVADEVEDAPEISGALRKLPVVGRVQAGPDGLLSIDDVMENDGFMIWWSVCAHAYALRIRGESMSPRYRPGEFVGVDPCAEVLPSDEVIVLLADGKRMIKRLLWQRDEQLCFESVNQNYQNIILEKTEISAMHLVLGHIPKAAFRSE